MLQRGVFLVCVSFVLCGPENVTRKLCKDVNTSQCTVKSVVVDPCPLGPVFCVLKRNKIYGVTLDMTPPDVEDNGSFSTAIKSPGDACGLLFCPLEAEQRRIFDIELTLDKRASGKFPIKVKIWNENDESQACCITFNVKVNK